MNRLTSYLRRIIPAFRRKHKRYPAMEGMYVVLGVPGPEGLGFQVIDVSLGGVAFLYQGAREDLERFEKLSITDGDRCFVDNVMFRLVGHRFINTDQWRVASEFRYMGVLEKSRLKDFINSSCYCE